MTIAEALVSGFVQGLTEFLPVSSSGHLVLVHRIFGLAEPSMFFDICLHAATLMAVVLYFRGDIYELCMGRNVKGLFYIAIGTIPAVLAALFFEKHITIFFESPRKVEFMLIVTGLILFLGQFGLQKIAPRGKGPTFRSSLLVGLAQAFALLPGISRSGITISTGALGGMSATEAFRFSFLLSVPVIMGATAYKGLTLDTGIANSGSVSNYIVGMGAALVVGLLSLRLLEKIVRERRLYIFGIYCLLTGTIGLLFWS